MSPAALSGGFRIEFASYAATIATARYPADARRRAAARWRGADDFARRPNRAGGPQRFRQVDAASHRRRESAVDGGTRFAQPNARLRYLPQEPDLTGFATTLDFVLAGLDDEEGAYRARALHGGSRGRSRGRSRETFRRRGATGGAGARSRRGAGHPAARRTDEPSRSRRDRVAGERAAGLARRLRPDQPRQAAARGSDQGDGLARSGRDAPPGAGVLGVRGLAGPEARGRGSGTPQARSEDRRRGTLDALRRHRAAQAQHAPRRGARGDAPGAAGGAARGRGRDDGRAGRPDIGRARDRGRGDFEGFRGPSDRQGFFVARDARRPAGDHRRQRRRQDHTGQFADRPVAAGRAIVRLGSQVSMATLDQRRATLSPTTTLVDALDRRRQRLRDHRRTSASTCSAI